MGIFKKIFKGIGKVFKGIGKVLKKGWRKFGKFMNKLGIVGQIGMFFITGGIANALMQGLAPIFSAVGSFAKGLPGVGAIFRGAQKFVATAGKVFRTVTDGVGDFIKTGLNKIPGIQLDLSASGTWLENLKVNVKEIGETWRTTGVLKPPVTPPGEAPTPDLGGVDVESALKDIDIDSFKPGDEALDFYKPSADAWKRGEPLPGTKLGDRLADIDPASISLGDLSPEIVTDVGSFLSPRTQERGAGFIGSKLTSLLADDPVEQFGGGMVPEMGYSPVVSDVPAVTVRPITVEQLQNIERDDGLFGYSNYVGEYNSYLAKINAKTNQRTGQRAGLGRG